MFKNSELLILILCRIFAPVLRNNPCDAVLDVYDSRCSVYLTRVTAPNIIPYSYGRVTWQLTRWKEHVLRVLENKSQRRMF
jgi:hypothetical protein